MVLIGMLGASAALGGLTEYQTAVRSEPTLISYYTFDADSGAVTDTASGGHNGVLAGTGTTFTDAAGAFGGIGQALSLNGSGWVNFGAVADFAFGTQAAPLPGAVEMWIRPGLSNYPTNPALAGVRNGANTRWSMHLQGDRNSWGVFADGMGYHNFNYNMKDDKWYHVVMQFAPDYTSTWIYVNGLWIGDFWGMLGDGTDQSFEIGSSSPTGAELFTGLIDEVAIYSNYLPDATIARHYELMNPTSTTPLPILSQYQSTVAGESSLIALYDFEGDTTQVTDKKGTANGTLTGGTTWSGGFAGGQALDCSVGTGYATMGPQPAFAFLDGSGSLEAWVAPWPGLGYWDTYYMNTLGIRPTILSCADDFDNTYYAMEVRPSDSAAGMEILGSGGSTIKAMAPIPGGLPTTENWYHMVAVFNAGQTTFYINGQQVLTQALPLLPTEGFLYNFQIGAVDPSNDWVWLGKLDEVALYSGALSPTQVFSHYAAAAMTFSLHQQEFVMPASPISMTVSAPAGQATSEGQVLTFSYDPAVVNVTATLPIVGSVPVPNGPITIPAGGAGLSSIPLTITPVGGGYTNLTVSGGATWPFGDMARFHVSMGSTIVDDHFDDGNVGTNTTTGLGGGWNQFWNGTSQTEAGTNWTVSNGGYNWSSGGIRSKSAGTFQVMTADGSKVEWIISDVSITAPDNSTKGQFPGGETSACRHELGIVSIDLPGSAGDLFNNANKGGLYIDLFYTPTGAVPTQSIAVTGNVRVVNRNHSGGDGEGSAGLETVATFALPNVTSITPATPLILSAAVNQAGWSVAFANDILANFAVDTTAHPGLSVANGRLSGGWDAASLNDAAITTEFSTGANINVLFQNENSGRGTGSLDYVKVCVNCHLATDCPDPFADADSDGDVDQDDFGMFQACYTGTGGGVPEGCRCFNKYETGGIDSTVLAAFLNCAAQSGPTVPVPKTCDD